MKSFDERKEEIFRRSQARIRRAKAVRARIVATCIPLALSAAVLLLLPESTTPTIGPEAITTAPGFTTGHTGMGTRTNITVSRNDQILTYGDAAAVDAILASLDAICDREPQLVVENFGNDFQTTPSSLAWQITVVQGNIAMVYHLDGSELMLKGQTWLLTEAELQALYLLLGLPQP